MNITKVVNKGYLISLIQKDKDELDLEDKWFIEQEFQIASVSKNKFRTTYSYNLETLIAIRDLINDLIQSKEEKKDEQKI